MAPPGLWALALASAALIGAGLWLRAQDGAAPGPAPLVAPGPAAKPPP